MGYTTRPYTSKSNVTPTRYTYLLLRAGALTAHRVYRLMLLGSPPDMVHSSQLRETHSSSQQNTGQTVKDRPSEEGSTPAVADFRCRAPLSPRLVWPCCTAQSCFTIILYQINKIYARGILKFLLFSMLRSPQKMLVYVYLDGVSQGERVYKHLVGIFAEHGMQCFGVI